jgi:hypothetical protein
LNVVRAMYMRTETELRPVVAGGSPPRDPLLVSAVGLSVVVTVASFVLVQPLIEVARDAAESLPF